MRKAKKNQKDIHEEYDFSRGVRGKYAKRYAQGTNVIVLEPGVAKVFPNAQSVNDALRTLADIMRHHWKRA